MFSEAQLEEEIMLSFVDRDFTHLSSKGFDFLDDFNEDKQIMWYSNQVQLNPYGIADIVTSVYNREDNDSIEVSIIELKVTELKSSHIEQLLMYKTAIERHAEIMFPNLKVKINTVLITNGISSGHYIHRHVDGIVLYTYKHSIFNGIEFKLQSNDWLKSGDEDIIADKDYEADLGYLSCINNFKAFSEKEDKDFKEHTEKFDKVFNGELGELK